MRTMSAPSSTGRSGMLGTAMRLFGARAMFRRNPLGAVLMFGVPMIRWYLRRQRERRLIDQR